MSIETAAGYFALALVSFLLPSGRMLEFANWQRQRGLRASPVLGLGIIIARAFFFWVGLIIAAFLTKVIPDGLTLAKIVACLFIVITTVKCLFQLKRPFPISGNDNLPERKIFGEVWYGMRAKTRSSYELALAIATVVFFVSPSSISLQAAEMFGAAHLTASLLSLVLYAIIAHPLLTRLNHQKKQARSKRVENLLRSGLPRVSARYRQDAA